MKTAISLPDSLFLAAERIQRRKKISRSEFYANAIRWYVEKEEHHGITEQLNRVYAHTTAGEEAAALADLPKNDWV